MSLAYSYDVQDVTPLTEAARLQFDYWNSVDLKKPDAVKGIRTSRIVPAYNYNSIDHPITPSRGRQIFLQASIAGLGGNVRTVQPTVELKWFRRGLEPGHVMGFRLLGRTITGYGGINPPPLSRFYIGGETDVRGFDILGVSPVAWTPTATQVPVLNSDGSPRLQKVLSDGEYRLEPATLNVPFYLGASRGGDASLVGNYEYRVPLTGPVTLALFVDAGLNKIIFPNQLQLSEGRLDALNSAFPQAGFPERAIIAEGPTRLRTSTGVELQVLMPVVNAPFRLYWAYNPNVTRTELRPPVVADRSLFPNQATYLNALDDIYRGGILREDRTAFRFAIGTTF